MSALAGRILHRAVELLERIEFTPSALRQDFESRRVSPRLLHSAFELIAHAADLLSDSAGLVHDNEPRWRRFRARVDEVVRELDSSDDSADSHVGWRQSTRSDRDRTTVHGNTDQRNHSSGCAASPAASRWRCSAFPWACTVGEGDGSWARRSSCSLTWGARRESATRRPPWS